MGTSNLEKLRYPKSHFEKSRKYFRRIIGIRVLRIKEIEKGKDGFIAYFWGLCLDLDRMVFPLLFDHFLEMGVEGCLG